jgi:ketosteroid isomerase-like protein
MSQENGDLEEAAFAALDQRNLDAFLALIHPEVEFRSLVAEVEGTTYRGHDGVREWWDTMAAALGGIRFEAEQARWYGDRGIIRVRVVGSVEGVEVPVRQWQAVRVLDGLIVWWGIFRTEAEALEAVELRG